MESGRLGTPVQVIDCTRCGEDQRNAREDERGPIRKCKEEEMTAIERLHKEVVTGRDMVRDWVTDRNRPAMRNWLDMVVPHVERFRPFVELHKRWKKKSW